MRLSYEEYCKEFIVDRLGDFEGNTFHDCYELAQSITQSINIDGSATYSTWEAKEYIKEWWDDCGDFVQDYEDNFGEKPHFNVFDEPEKFHCLMVIVGVENLIQGAIFTVVKENEDQEDFNFELTKELIKQLKEELKQ